MNIKKTTKYSLLAIGVLTTFQLGHVKASADSFENSNESLTKNQDENQPPLNTTVSIPEAETRVVTEPNSDFFSNHWLSAITIDAQKTGFDREQLRLKLQEENIESRPLWKPMHLQPVFADALYYGGNVAENLFNNGLCLPSGSNLTAEDLERIKNVIENML